MRKLPIFLLLLSFSLAWPECSLAAATGLIITPALEQITVKTGSGQTTAEFEVGNYTSTAQNLHLQIVDFSAGGENSDAAQLTLDSPSNTNKYGLAEWASLDQNSLSLQPGQSKEVTVRINDNSALVPGGHYGALVVTNLDPVPYQSKPEVAVSQSLSGLLFVTKTGGEVYGVHITDLKSNGPLIDSTSTLSLRFQNTGNVHLTPRGIAQVYDPSGRLISQGVINQSSDILFPETSRVEEVRLTSVTKAAIPGRYRLVIQYHPDGIDTLSSASLSFYYIQTGQLVVLVVIFLLVAGGSIFIWIKRKPKQRARS